MRTISFRRDKDVMGHGGWSAESGNSTYCEFVQFLRSPTGTIFCVIYPSSPILLELRPYPELVCG